MVLCSKCNKNVAVVFVTKVENGKEISEGICMSCAKDMGLKPLDNLLSKLGIDEEEFTMMNNQLKDMMEDGDLSELFGDNMTMLEGGEQSEMPEKEAPPSEEDKAQKNTQKAKLKKKSFLDIYGVNLNEKAQNNEIDAVIGRDTEIMRVINILNRRTKNNPVLLGEPGVGKTAIAEGLALKIIKGEVPHKLINAEIYLVDFAGMLAGTQFRGQFEQRLKTLITEAIERKNIILVIDELHNIVAAGDANGAMNAANILKPYLAKGELKIIGATTPTEYRKHIEKDTALERRFATVEVCEPDIYETIEILKGIKGYYEDYHKVNYSDEAIETAAIMADRYIFDRKLPDKAIDLLDESGAVKNVANDALVKLDELGKELDKIIEQKEEAVLSDSINDYQKAADFKIKECKLRENIKALEKTAFRSVSTEDIATVIESITKIPVRNITGIEAKNLVNLEEKLSQRIAGQTEAVKAVSGAVRRGRAGLSVKRKPTSFIFAGPTGVGKTELVKTLAYELFGTEESIIRFDMSEYMEKHTASKLIGSPPGYVGYDDAGMLTEKIRKKPYSIILFDEIEKAHSDVFNLLLQILDDGILTDSHGKTVRFYNSIIIMTTNAGSDYKGASLGFTNNNIVKAKEKVDSALKEFFRPEFLNRVDRVVVFDPLTRVELAKICEIMLSDIIKNLANKKLNLTYTQAVVDYLIENGFDEKFGARPLRRLIERELEDKVADLFIAGTIGANDKVIADCKNNEIVVSLGV
jgi:ATP-dependent Clp protease ATP-binding subunit ClpE